jgi:hypothetical protein
MLDSPQGHPVSIHNTSALSFLCSPLGGHMSIGVRASDIPILYQSEATIKVWLPLRYGYSTFDIWTIEFAQMPGNKM